MKSLIILLIFQINLLYRQQFLTPACITGSGNVRSLRDNVALNLRVERENGERISILTASSWMGAKKDGMCNICELLINVVTVNRPKMLAGLNQNGWSVRMSLHAICDSPGEQADTNPSGMISGTW